MANLPEIRRTRLGKLKKIISAGLDPYPAHTRRTHTIAEAIKGFSKLKNIVLAGRIMTMRGHGGAVFLDLKDGTGKMQVLLMRWSASPSMV